MRLDLHVHSTASDGTLSPVEVVRAAKSGGLDVIALADHDSTAGVAAAQEEAASLAIELVPAIEISSDLSENELHILGYFIDPSSPSLVAHETRAVTRREERMREMIERLDRQGIAIEFAEVLAVAGTDCRVLARPHLAKAMVLAGVVTTVGEAFQRFIGDGHPAFIPTRLVSPERAIELVLEAGGTPVWAHPPEDLLERLLPRLVSAGLRGLEVYRPRATADHILRLEAVARRAGLVRSGGSDWHGPEGGVELGDFHVTAEEVGALLDAGGM